MAPERACAAQAKAFRGVTAHDWQVLNSYVQAGGGRANQVPGREEKRDLMIQDEKRAIGRVARTPGSRT